MASIHILPDELVERILAYWLCLSPEAFARQRLGRIVEGDTSLYQSADFRQPSLLLVCKRWLVIGTPLLYESVTILSPHHVARLAQTVSETPAIAKAIKRLALYGAGPGIGASSFYGRGLGAFLKYVCDIRTLRLDFNFGSRESVSGLCKWLPVLSPSVLILSGLPRNKVGREVYSALLKSIPKWTRLVCLAFSILFDRPYAKIDHSQERIHCLMFSLSSELEDAIGRANNLRELRLNYAAAHILLQRPAGRQLIAGPSFQRLVCVPIRSWGESLDSSMLKRNFPYAERRIYSSEGEMICLW